MIRQKNSNVKEQKRSDRISQQCDLVEELSNEDLENVAGGTLSSIGTCRRPPSHIMYGIVPIMTGITTGIIMEFHAVNLRF